MVIKCELIIIIFSDIFSRCMNGLVECTLVRCGGLLKYYKFTITTIKKMYVVTTATLNKLELLQLMANQLELYGITCWFNSYKFSMQFVNFFFEKKKLKIIWLWF